MRASTNFFGLVVIVEVLLASMVALQAQDQSAVRSIEAAPSSLVMKVGERGKIVAVVRDGLRRKIEDAVVVYFSTAPESISVGIDGNLEALRAGEYEVVAWQEKFGAKGMITNKVSVTDKETKHIDTNSISKLKLKTFDK